MKRATSFTLGVFLLIVGVLWLLYLLGVITNSFVFDGWWTLFIIVPSLYGLFTSPRKVPPYLGLGIGVLLLLAAQDVIPYHMVGKLFLAVLIIVIGLSLILGRRKPTADVDSLTQVSRDGKDIKQIAVSFGEQKLNFDNQLFQGADVNASFGTVQLDLRHATIPADAVINLDCAFSGITILCPPDINLQISTSNILGGTSDKRAPASNPAAAITLYITGNVVLSGVDIL